MNKEELISRIEIILNKESNDLFNSKLTFGLKGSEVGLSYSHSDTLIDIFSNVQEDNYLKAIFVATLRKEISEKPENYYLHAPKDIYAGTVALAFYTLLKLGFVEEVLESLKNRTFSSGTILKFLPYLFNEKYTYFNINHLNELLKKINGMNIEGAYRSRIREEFNELKNNAKSIILKESYESLKKEIKGVNIEINIDKREVSTKVGYLGFDSKYISLLNELDVLINKEDSPAITSGMVGNLRSFMEDLFTDIAKKISSKENEEIPKEDRLGPMGNIRNYIKIKLELSDEENSFLNKFINILHAEGGHSFMANKEYFRLAKNIAIEIALFILSKYETKFVD